MQNVAPHSDATQLDAPPPKTLDVYGFVPSAIYRRKKAPPSPLSEDEILAWADAYFARHGKWPSSLSGTIPEAPGETWSKVNNALRYGYRGLLGNASLALLLADARGKEYWKGQPPLSIQQILAWADAFYARHGTWPVSHKNVSPERRAIPESRRDTWSNVNQALTQGTRSLPGGSSLARLLQQERGKHHRLRQVSFTEELILEWADAYFARYGEWPVSHRKAQRITIPESPRDTWTQVNHALTRGDRGLPGGSSLARLLAEERGALNPYSLPDFTEEQILQWADAHFARTGNWPGCNSLEPIPECPAENWRKVNNALRLGLRGMPGDSSVTILLADRRGKRHPFQTRRFTEEHILEWADAYFTRTGDWPTRHAGPIAEAPDETWKGVDLALYQGVRGLPGGSSVARLLASERGVRNKAALPPFSEDMILEWADAHHARTGHYPCGDCGPIPEAPGETWMSVQGALLKGTRGLPSGSSVALLMAERRGERNLRSLPPLTEELILQWADAHFARTGEWPECRNDDDNPVIDAPGERWDRLSACLMRGQRGLPGGATLAQLLRDKRGKRFIKGLPPLTEEQILAWADAHFARTGKWPICKQPVVDAPGETWGNINNNLRTGDRGLPGGTSLAQLLEEKRGKRMRLRTTPLTLRQIGEWARAHLARTGTWPHTTSGEVVGGDGALWSAIDKGLKCGSRGLPGGMTLSRLVCALEEEEDRASHETPRKAA